MGEGAQPTVMRYVDLERRTWGDEGSGRLSDWFYADDAELNLNIVGMAANGAAVSSPANPTIFGADELFYVLEGRLVQSNPTTGEVLVANAGEGIFFRKDTWHYQWNYSNTQLRMLEFFQPAPKTGTGGAYARASAPLDGPPKQGQDQFLGRWPMGLEERERERTAWVVRDDTILWRMEGATRGREILVGIMASTEHLTAGKIRFLGGQRSCEYQHNGEKVVFVEAGNLHVEFPETKRWVELEAFDGVRIPAGVRHSFYNMSSDYADSLFSVATDYRPGCLEP